MVLAEWLDPARLEPDALSPTHSDLATLEARALRSGMVSLWSRALGAIEAGLTTPAEIRRVLGFNNPIPQPRSAPD